MLEKFFFKAIVSLCQQSSSKLKDDELVRRLEDQALLVVEVFARHYPHDWMHETMNMIVPKHASSTLDNYAIAHKHASSSLDNYAIAHFAV